MEILPKIIMNSISIKNVKENFGHDLCGFFCNIYFHKKKIGYLNNDGWGGGADIVYNTKEIEVTFKKFLEENNFAQFKADAYNLSNKLYNHDNNWKPSDFNIDDQVEFLCERLNFHRIIEKYQKNSVVIGSVHSGSIRRFTYKIPLIDVMSDVIGFRQSMSRIKAQMNDNEYILNTNISANFL